MKKTTIYRFLKRHSLSLATGLILLLWIVSYSFADPRTHPGAFFGNAIADWSGLFTMVIITKYLYEIGSVESRRPPREESRLPPLARRILEHSLSIFIVITGVAWAFLFVRLDTQSKWGEVVGNIVSEWTQTFGLIILTKHLLERHSRESRR